MQKQNYKNHIRYYFPHHFIFYPIILILAIYSACNIAKYPEQSLEWKFITAIIILIGWFSFMTRQHYGLRNQDRIIRLELRLRYHILTKQRFETIESRLSFRQIAALRFASDEELPELVQRALNENLTGREIKKAIKNWLPDYMRL